MHRFTALIAQPVRSIKKIQLSCLSFTIISALILTAQNVIFFKTVITLTSDAVFTISFIVILFLAFNVCMTALSLPYIQKIFMCIFLLLAPVVVYFIYAYNVLIDEDMIRNTFETNLVESAELISVALVAFFAFFGLLPAALVIWVKIKPAVSIKKAVKWRVLNILLSLLILLPLLMLSYKDVASFFRNNKWTAKQIVPSNYIAGIYNLYSDYKEASRVFEPIGLDAQQRSEHDKPLLFVFVIGETARNENFSLGGYERETDPLMKAQDNLLYGNMTSCNTSTATSLPCMFSDKSRKEYESWYGDYRGNVLDVAQNAGSEVFWIENNSSCYGICERVPWIYTKSDENSQLCNDGNCFDEIMIPELTNFIDDIARNLSSAGAPKNTLVVLHQLGSHGPAYYKRYPAEYKKFTPTCDTNTISECDRQKLINTYDNTILYTDAFLNMVVDELQGYSDNYAPVMLYASDHGESLGENGLYLHATPYAIAPSQQVQVPLMLWLSDEYLSEYGVDKQCVEAAMARDGLSHDNIFHTVMGIMDLTSTEYDASLDLLNGCK